MNLRLKSKKYYFVFPLSLVFLFVVFALNLIARDINLDNIYIKPSSLYYSRLIEQKLDAYQSVNAQFIDRDVIFAAWKSGFEIIYVKELQDINIFYLYNRTTRKKSELLRLQGALSAIRCTANGLYFFIKRIIISGNSIPVGETLIINTGTKNIQKLPPSYPFIDFSVSPGGNSVLYETSQGIVELFPESKMKQIRVKRSHYSDIVQSGSPTIAYLSPNKMKSVVISGSGGNYQAKIIAGKRSWPLHGLTSATEIFWINNNSIMFRSGSTGSFSVMIYNTRTHKYRTLSSNSLNTNIQYSPFPKMAAFLRDQLINIYDIRNDSIIITGIEGEDISFSPDGNRFSSLLIRKLFITSMNTMLKKNIELKNNAEIIKDIYNNLLKKRRDWANEYSGTYIKRKISIYKKIIE